jgi:hypothetical protein
MGDHRRKPRRKHRRLRTGWLWLRGRCLLGVRLLGVRGRGGGGPGRTCRGRRSLTAKERIRRTRSSQCDDGEAEGDEDFETHDELLRTCAEEGLIKES